MRRWPASSTDDAASTLIGNGMQLSVLCSEDVDRLPADSGPSKDSVLGSLLLDVARTQCEVWPRGERPADFNEPARGDRPVLVLAGEFDPVTPPRYGEQIVATLERAKLVVAGAGPLGDGSRLHARTGRPLDTLDPAALDTACTSVSATRSTYRLQRSRATSS